MTNMKEPVERREHNRFKVRTGAFAAITSYNIVGPIQNISKGGLAFRYISEEDQIPEWSEVDLFIGGKGFHMKKIPSKTISGFNIIKKSLYSSLTIKQCGVQFGELTNSQIYQLENFIQNYAEKRSGKDRRQSDPSQYSGPERRNGIERRKGLAWI